ncbi:unnamed protein product, partial [Didymodactylos carnosus]
MAAKRSWGVNQQQKQPEPNLSRVRKAARAEVGVKKTGKKQPSKLDKQKSLSSTQSRTSTFSTGKTRAVKRSHAATYTLAMSEDNESLVAAPYSAK